MYSKTLGDSHYEVRTAGASVRLYSNGVLHSQFNPKQVISGAIWDLLLLPGFLKKEEPRQILLLGLGGGTLVHLIRHFFPQASITCVELDKHHIQIAKRFFKIPTKSVELHQGDAYAFLKNTDRKYDWIIDDVFQHVTGEPERTDSSYQTLKLYKRCLEKSGLLSLNLIGKQQLENAHSLFSGYSTVVQFTHPLYENRIIAMSNSTRSTRQFNQSLAEHSLLDKKRASCRLKFRMRKMK